MAKRIEDVALFDMDGTLVDYEKGIRESYEKIRSPREPKYTPFQGDEDPIIKARIRLIRNQMGWWENLPRLQLGFDVLEAALELGFSPHILTKGPSSSPNAWTEKVNWVKRELPAIPITVTQDKGLVYGKILVDDFPEYAERWLEWRPRGLVIMPASESNKDFSHPQVLRYDGTNLELIREFMWQAKQRA